eukprot:TRINITY_DN1382_c8_g1_i1.p1 TRINITY_DN1382_c8_g1~~TRINITY_DN1382_c8_g1_i1.p1  ORF type:complete len:484 (-),score=61.96 TRINITY_DN1382_c8_g1_i1:138-1526(-)
MSKLQPRPVWRFHCTANEDAASASPSVGSTQRFGGLKGLAAAAHFSLNLITLVILVVCGGLVDVASAEPPIPKPSRTVHFYTFSDTVPHPGLCALAEATSALGGVLRVIGLSKRPGYILIHSHSPTLKFLMLQDVLEYELRVGRIAEDDLMIFADGHDVLLQRPLADIVKAYEKFPGSPYLISGERNCWPWPHSDPSHGNWHIEGEVVHANRTWTINRWMEITPWDFCRIIVNNGPYRYPNIGLSMGPVNRFLEVLKRNNRIVLDEDVNDQGAMWLVVMRHALELNIVIDQKAEVFLNMLEYEPGHLEREPCGPDWFTGQENAGARKGLPPRNVLTNTTPGLMHFNGPSHEDGTWPGCYYANVNKFRSINSGHAFFDVDHNIMVSTDHICDYSWYKVRDFHAHPVTQNTLAFLEGFYKLPVDPDLLASRGTDSAVDEVRLGRVENLHTQSPLIYEAMHGKKA